VLFYANVCTFCAFGGLRGRGRTCAGGTPAGVRARQVIGTKDGADADRENRIADREPMRKNRENPGVPAKFSL
jgi:hypothetical protein